MSGRAGDDEKDSRLAPVDNRTSPATSRRDAVGSESVAPAREHPLETQIRASPDESSTSAASVQAVDVDEDEPDHETLLEGTTRILWEEFKLVQDKIDRIGDFHFRVRTWAITLVSAVVVGGFAKNIGWYLYMLSCLPVLSFQLIDRAQSSWQRALMGRGATLETELRRALQNKGPRIVHAIRGMQAEILKPWFGSLVVNNGRVFYVVMYALLIVASGVSFFSTYCLSLGGHDLCIGAP